VQTAIATGQAVPPETIKQIQSLHAGMRAAVDSILSVRDTLQRVTLPSGSEEQARLSDLRKADGTTLRRIQQTSAKSRDYHNDPQLNRSSCRYTIKELEYALQAVIASPDSAPAAVRANPQLLPEATAKIDAAQRLLATAGAFQIPDSFLKGAQHRIKGINEAVRAANQVLATENSGGSKVNQWTAEQKSTPLLKDGLLDPVNVLRFASQFAPDDPFIITGGPNRTVRCWGQTSSGSFVVLWYWSSRSEEQINDLAISGSAPLAVSASNGSTVRAYRWNVGTSPLRANTVQFPSGSVRAFERHSGSVISVAFNRAGNQVASGSADRTVRTFTAPANPSAQLQQDYFSKELPGAVTSVAFNRGSDDALVVSGCTDGWVRLHTISGAPPQDLHPSMSGPVRRPEFSYDDACIIAASEGGEVRVWQREATAITWLSDFKHPAAVTHATFRPEAPARKRPFITCCVTGEIRFWADAHPLVAGRVLEPRHSGPALSATWSKDGRWLATIGGGEAILWDCEPEIPEVRLRLTGLPTETSGVEFSPGERFLATFGSGSPGRLWDLRGVIRR
jgi:WD40 repeat protein